MGSGPHPRERHGSLKRLARRVQRRIESFYGLEAGPDVGDFLRDAGDGAREALVVRECDDGLELSLSLPAVSDNPSLDERMQVVEGVSHFVYLVERARVGLPATELELELQAEVDKFVLLAFDRTGLVKHRAGRAHHTLYRAVRFLHGEETPQGQRYRLANDLAARISERVFRLNPRSDARRWLIRFYRSGQTEKIRLARAA
jgi:hypothetical protein